jgi:hypothetical protein
MTFTEATKHAPSGVDFIQYTDHVGTIVTIQRRSDGIWDAVANTQRIGADLVAAGISASRKSLWDADRGQMLCGPIADMFTTSNEE